MTTDNYGHKSGCDFYHHACDCKTVTAPNNLLSGATMTDEQITRLIGNLREYGGRNTIHPHSGAWMIDAADALALLSASKPAAPANMVYVECRQCDNCGHIGINDGHENESACNSCRWSGPTPDEDKCPECGNTNCMTVACPKCSNRYEFLSDGRFPADEYQAPAAPSAEAAAPAQSERPDPNDIQGWSVTINANAQDILMIGHNSLSGIDNIEDFAPVVRNCAEHLLSFIGAAPAQSGEPVAWRAPNLSGSDEPWAYRDADDRFEDSSGNLVGEPLYAAPQVASQDDERAAFEDVEKKRRHGYGGDTLTRYPDNDEEYLLPLVQARWVGWQARAKEKS